MLDKRALLSVSDKTGVVNLAKGLLDLGFQLVSTGGTQAVLYDAGLPSQQVSDITGFPEILDGRVKTLHPSIHGGLLARRDNRSDMSTIASMGISEIQVLACNLYPFAATLASGESHSTIVDQIDIGGPAMIRSAAKNSDSVFVVVDPLDYPELLETLGSGSGSQLRASLASKAFGHTALYDGMVAAYLAGHSHEMLPYELAIPMTKVRNLSYGENPHQSRAALYRPGSADLGGYALGQVEQLHGPKLSYNNLLDASAAWELVSDFEEPAVAVVKHGNPCGFAVGGNKLAEIYRRAYEGDTISIFGGVVATNQTLDTEMVSAMRGILLHIIAAPNFTPTALKQLKRRKSTRLLKLSKSPYAETRSHLPLSNMEIRSVSGGYLLQDRNSLPLSDLTTTVVSKRQPTQEQLNQLRFAWRTVKHVKSNAIVLAKSSSIVGVGAGQMSRVDSVFMALHRAGDRAPGAVLASDAFFPFVDGPQMALDAGVTGIIEPGGSKRDEEVIDIVDRHGAVLVFTGGERHFRH